MTTTAVAVQSRGAEFEAASLRPAEDIVMVPPESLHLLFHSPNQVRGPGDEAYSEESLRGLADSIRSKGRVLQNLCGVQHDDGTIGIHAGGRRLAAVQLLAEEGVPIPVPVRLEDPEDAEATVDSLVENLVRRDMRPWQKATAIQRILAADEKPGATKRLAQIIGWTQRSVQIYHAMARDLCPQASELLEAGEITVEDARDLARLKKKLQLRALELLEHRRRGQLTEELSPDSPRPDLCPVGIPLRVALGAVGLQVRSAEHPAEDDLETLPSLSEELPDGWLSGDRRSLSLWDLATPHAAAATKYAATILYQEEFEADCATYLKSLVSKIRESLADPGAPKKGPGVHGKKPFQKYRYSWNVRHDGDWAEADDIFLYLGKDWTRDPEGLKSDTYLRDTDTYRLKLKIEVFKRPQKQEHKTPASRPEPGSALAAGAAKDHLCAARILRSRALQSGLARNEMLALRLLLLALLNPEIGWVLKRVLPLGVVGGGERDGVVDEDTGRQLLSRMGGEGVLSLDENSNLPTVKGRDEAVLVGALDALAEIPDKEVPSVLAQMVAGLAQSLSPSWQAGVLGDSRVAVDLAERLEIASAVDDSFEFTDAWLRGYDKRTLLAIGFDSGALSKKDVKSLRKRDPTVIRELILLRALREGWSPPELRFGSTEKRQAAFDDMRKRAGVSRMKKG